MLQRRPRRLSAAGGAPRPGTGVFGRHAFLVTGSATCAADRRRAVQLLRRHGGVVLDHLPPPPVTARLPPPAPPCCPSPAVAPHPLTMFTDPAWQAPV